MNIAASRCLESNWPNVSIGIPTLNSERYMHTCLRSIFTQKYPAKIEVIIVDGNSNDRTLRIARRFPVTVLENVPGGSEEARWVACLKSTGDIFFHLDADNELTSPNWLRDMIYPLIVDHTIVGSFTHHLATEKDSAITRYLSYDKLQRDPLLAFFSIGIDETFVARRKGYILCRFTPDRTPPVGLVLYRRKDIFSLLETERLDERRILDIDLPATFAKAGRTNFAYVPIGLRHAHVDNAVALIRKRVRNVRKCFLPTCSTRKFTWFSIQDINSLAKILQWLGLSCLFIPLIISGLRKYLRYRDRVLILEPFVGIVVTFAVLFAFISDYEGRKMIGRALTTILSGEYTGRHR